MPDTFQRLITMSATQPLGLNAQAGLGPVREPERSQISLLIRHFLERFFNHETASPDGDGKARLILIAFAAGLPGFMVALYLWPAYHPWPSERTDMGPPPYWAQVNHHFFFVLYSFVAMGLVTMFEWDLFFPDLLDVFVLGILPIAERRVFLARAGAITVFILGFLLMNFVGGHVAAVAGSGLFATTFILALQGVLLSVLGEHLFRRISLALQGFAVTVLVILFLLFPVLSGVTPGLLLSGRSAVLWFPPFWFLGIYQRLMEGASAPPIFTELSKIGCVATLITAAIATASYPLAYLRKVRQLVEGTGTRSTRNRAMAPLNAFLHATLVRPPIGRAVFHFIGQTLMRVPRYRIYLVLYGGVGLSVVVATVLRFTIAGKDLHVEISADGIRAAIGIVVFWVIAGLRTAFVSSGNQRGSWLLRVVHGRPPHFDAAMGQLRAAEVWVMTCAAAVTLAAMGALWLVAPIELREGPAIAAQLLIAAGMCVLLTDAFFLNVMTVPFTGELPREQPNLALTLLKYFTFFPVVMGLSLITETWVETSGEHLGIAAISIVVAHLWFRKRHRDVVRLHSSQLELEEDEEDFPMRLGLRY
jgi:hypothetical protein